MKLTEEQKDALLGAVDEAAFIEAALATQTEDGAVPEDFQQVVFGRFPPGIAFSVEARLALPGPFLLGGIPWAVPTGTPKPTAKHQLDVPRSEDP